ncbi:hypothetical protein SAMN05421663_104136 [Terribacillus halophilus]|uniref:Uncharacterized protein n=1 Tax=Terribacillus halophilus TaxID=361279 RepID=A0A1G6PI76_9BACI|nr:hypothetical protein [Terribacillus halophilus]SDC79691.1 hypothetical protein SAMN05421663_104136 [Terribacillus halophilus]
MSEEKKVIHVKNLIIKADKVVLDTDDIEKDKHDHDRKNRDFDFDPIFGPRRKRNDDHDDKRDDDKHDDDKKDDDKGQGRRNFWF